MRRVKENPVNGIQRQSLLYHRDRDLLIPVPRIETGCHKQRPVTGTLLSIAAGRTVRITHKPFRMELIGTILRLAEIKAGNHADPPPVTGVYNFAEQVAIFRQILVNMVKWDFTGIPRIDPPGIDYQPVRAEFLCLACDLFGIHQRRILNLEVRLKNPKRLLPPKLLFHPDCPLSGEYRRHLFLIKLFPTVQGGSEK